MLPCLPAGFTLAALEEMLAQNQELQSLQSTCEWIVRNCCCNHWNNLTVAVIIVLQPKCSNFIAYKKGSRVGNFFT